MRIKKKHVRRIFESLASDCDPNSEIFMNQKTWNDIREVTPFLTIDLGSIGGIRIDNDLIDGLIELSPKFIPEKESPAAEMRVVTQEDEVHNHYSISIDKICEKEANNPSVTV